MWERGLSFEEDFPFIIFHFSFVLVRNTSLQHLIVGRDLNKLERVGMTRGTEPMTHEK